MPAHTATRKTGTRTGSRFSLLTQYKHLPELQKPRSTFIENFCKETKIIPNGKKYFITGLFYTIFSNKHRYKQKKYMPELFRAFGYVFMFFSLEHKPIHVHVVGNDGDAKFEWNGSEFILKEKHNIKPSDMRKIKQMVDDNADIIVSRWNDFFKEVKL